MISVVNMINMGAQLRAGDASIKHTIHVAHEGHLINKLKDKAGIIMAIIYPSATGEGELNESVDANTTWIFILEKANQGQTDQQELEQYRILQDVILKARDSIVESATDDGCSIFTRLKPGSIQIVPEFMEFGGFNGWSMSLVF